MLRQDVIEMNKREREQQEKEAELHEQFQLINVRKEKQQNPSAILIRLDDLVYMKDPVYLAIK